MNRLRSLRLRLVLIVVALLAVVAAVIGVVSVVVLQNYLVGQVDESVSSAVQRATHGRNDGDGPGGGFVLGQGEGTVIALVQGGEVVSSGYLDADGGQRTLSEAAQAAMLDLIADGKPHTVNLTGTLGEYRMIAVLDSQRTTALITGLPLAGVQGTVRQLGTIFALVALVGLALAAIAAALTVSAALRPLRRVAQTAATVAELPLDRGDVDIDVRVPDKDTDPRTEVGRVGAALNRLLSTVGTALVVRKASEDKVRHFVADASHELRTPLASIRGYSELTRRTQPNLPDEVRHNLGRIESEAIRMTKLVEDLLLLARLDSHRELEQEDVDLSLIVVEAVGDAHAAGPDHDWDLDLPAEPVVVTGDEARLRQVIVNLLANARVHTPAGTTVTTSLAVNGDGAVTVRIADDGPGIAPGIRETLFERFARADASRARTTGSTGLGLAIVKGVVEAHGGSVDVASRPGETVFSVTLPPAHAGLASAPAVAAESVPATV